jgi:GT2 family glycosyltransferase
MPSLSIIIPTYNRLARLKVVLSVLEHQTYPCKDFDVIVVSDGSSDGTNDYLQRLSTPLRLTPLFQPNGGVATARNHGLQLAQGELVLFIDDDVVAKPELISEHLATHQREGDRIAVMGPMLIPPDFQLSPWAYWEQTMLNKQYDDMQAGRWAPTARQFYTGNVSLARRHLIEAGGFDAAFRRAEDVELGYRLAAMGIRFVYNPRAGVYHYVERSLKSWLEIPYTYGRNDVIFTRDRGQTWLAPRLLREFHGRKALIRWMTWLCLDHPMLSNFAIRLMHAVADAGARLHSKALPRAAYSGIFNLRHFQGMADEMGSRAVFFRAVAHARPSEHDEEPAILKPPSQMQSRVQAATRSNDHV